MELNASRNKSDFYDGRMPDNDGNPVPGRDRDPALPLAVMLNRRFEGDREDFQLRRRIAYANRTFGRSWSRTDWTTSGLTQRLSQRCHMSWYRSPWSGPAALIHDHPDPRSRRARGLRRRARNGPGVDADRVFRDAMLDTDVGLIPRWLLWAAVADASSGRGAGPGPTWTWLARWYRLVRFLAVLGIVYLGAGGDPGGRGSWVR